MRINATTGVDLITDIQGVSTAEKSGNTPESAPKTQRKREGNAKSNEAALKGGEGIVGKMGVGAELEYIAHNVWNRGKYERR